MHSKITKHVRSFLSGLMGAGIALILLTTSSQSSTAFAQKAVQPPVGNYYSVNAIQAQDGTLVEKHSINGPSVPPAGFESERQPVELPASASLAENALSAGGGSTWVLGCSATAAGDIITIYDQDKYTDLYNGPFNNGKLPVGYNPWPPFIDRLGRETASHPVIASMKGLDGRNIFGTIDDYYIGYESALPDPYLGYGGGNTIMNPRLIEGAMDATSTATAGWAQHVWGDAIGDYMYTSQSAFGNVDGETQFYTYVNSATPFTCEEMSKNALPDGTLGIKQFYQARGYSVGTCYNQPTDNVISGGFSFAKLKTEIDAGRPVMLNLEGHTVVAVGYDAASKTVYIHDGWDFETHSMPWGGSYTGMALQSVSIVNIISGTPAHYTISGNAGIPNATITYTGGFTSSDSNGNYSFIVTESWFGTVTPSKDGYNFTPPSRSYKNVKENHTAQDYIATDSDFPKPFSKVAPSNGITNQPDILIISWETSIGAASYEYCLDTTNDNTCSNWTSNGSSTSKVLSGLSASTTYYWHVRALNTSGTTYSNNAETTFWAFTTAPLTPVQAIDTWTADTSANWNPKTSFLPGDPIRWAIDVENSTGSNQQVTLTYVVKNPGGSIIVNSQGAVTTQPGIWSWAIDGTTPSMEGTYTLIGSVTYQGIKTTKSTTYTVALPCYTLSKSVIGNGSINVNPPPNCTTNSTQYRQGTVVQLTAAPYGGHGFDGWSGDSTGSLNPTSVTMTADKTVTASFSLLPPATPELISPQNGALLDTLSPILDWKDLSFTPDHYQLQFATSSDFSTGILYDQNLTESSFNIPTSLVSGKAYYWHIRAFNPAGAGSWSQTWVMNIKPAPVSLLAPAKDTRLPTLRPTFDWSDVTNTDIYTIQISSSAAFVPILLDETTQTSDFTPTKDLPAAQTLYWRVRSESGGAESNWSDVRAFSTSNPPGIPVLVSPKPDTVVMDSHPIFKWIQVSVPYATQFDHYQIQISTNPNFSPLSSDDNINDQSILMYTPATSLSANAQYYWRMRAYNKDNEASSWSEVRSFRTPNPSTSDNRPSAFSLTWMLSQPEAIAPQNNSTSDTLLPVLDWTDIPAATSYIVQISTDPGFANSSILVSATTIDSQYVSIKKLPSATVLYWRVLSLNKETMSNWSLASSFNIP